MSPVRRLNTVMTADGQHNADNLLQHAIPLAAGPTLGMFEVSRRRRPKHLGGGRNYGP